MTQLFKPDLYSPEGTQAAPRQPSLKGGKCSRCGYVFFPAHAYGCERCGAPPASVQAFGLSGRGTLLASAKVHMQASAAFGDSGGLEAPFVIGTIRLDDGPTIRTALADALDRTLKPGQRVEGRLDPVNSKTGTVLDLRFVPAS